jgi:hypothetical protein
MTTGPKGHATTHVQSTEKGKLVGVRTEEGYKQGEQPDHTGQLVIMAAIYQAGCHEFDTHYP